MAKLESSFLNMVLVLTGASLFAAVALGSVYSVTKGPIDASKLAKQQNAIREVLPAYDRLDEAEVIEVKGIGNFNVFKAYDAKNQFVGAAVESASPNGFSGEVKIMIGFDKSGAIVNYSVLEQKETPGLGTKMVDWFKPQAQAEKSLIEKVFGFEVKAAEKQSSILGKNPSTHKLTVANDGGEIDAITAATISSRAFLEAVKYAYHAYENNPDAPAMDGSSGATSASTDTNEKRTDVVPTTDTTSGATSESASPKDTTQSGASAVDATSGATSESDD